MRRVLLVSNKVFHYRVSNYNYFARRFREEGWEFVVRADELQKNNPHPPEFDFCEMPFSFPAYRREIERLQPDVVILFLHLKNLIIWPLIHWLKLKGIPVVYWNKGINLEVRNPRLRNLPFYYIHSLCDGIILYSQYELKDIKPKNRHKVLIANNTINFTDFPEIRETPAEIKSEFGIPFAKVVLFVGRMRPVKKVEHLIEVFNQLDEPGCGCVIVGDQMDYDLNALIHTDNIRYLGEIFDPQNIQISKLFKMADLFVIPGDVGLGMNQAFYWGLPVVTEDGLQPPEIHYLKNGRSGFVVAENDVAALREKTLLLLKDDVLRAEFSRNAREDILREASIETMFQGFLQCVSALSRKKPASTTSVPQHPAMGQNGKIIPVVVRFADWLDRYGETSQDHQDFYASKVGRAAKNLYYKNRVLGIMAVAPMVFCEAFAPWTRRFFFPRMRLPIADAHFAMGFACLHRATGERRYLDRAVHFLKVLEQARCPAYAHHGWGYPFDWQTQGGILAAGTPLITTTPYCYEAFDAVYRIDGNPIWRTIMRSTAEHALLDYVDHETRPGAASCTYTPHDGEYVVNASAYRAALLLQAYETFGDERYRQAAERNLAFVLDNQSNDGSWPYAVDGKRGFIDHFHTCFVLKGLAKAERITGDAALTRAIERGVRYYVDRLFDEDGLPKPFARRPRLTVYRRELYDCAECLNLGFLLRGRFSQLDRVVDRTRDDILQNWVRPGGNFRSRKLLFGWDNVPMHRWGHSEMFRSLTLWLVRSPEPQPPADAAVKSGGLTSEWVRSRTQSGPLI
ncbi:MAG TPA: glycosyltransferase [Candidatus Aquilonibacter sp.]|nr:glycosyltransferase [Candidatus Aquilonibacter sp.]